MDAGRIRLSGVGKRYTLFEDTPTLAYSLLHAWGRSRRKPLWAVREIDLEIEPGEAVGVMGRNGSGKSTLLQMLGGVTKPTTGELRVAGRIAPLISVGVGFHPELTGRENIYINAAILGLSRVEVDRRVDEIIAFSELEAFIDTPVKFYSSGMYVRLGFSVAAHVDPNVLLVDEVLAVGDLLFQMKCYQHLERLRQDGVTTVMVSHNIAAMENYCDRGILLDHGNKLFDGDIASAVSAYYQQLGSTTTAGDLNAGADLQVEAGVMELISAQLVGSTGAPRSRFTTGETAVVRARVQVKADVPGTFMSVTVLSATGVGIYHDSSRFRPGEPLAASSEAVFEVACPLELTTGAYALKFAIGRVKPHSDDGPRADDAAILITPQRLDFYVSGSQTAKGLVDLHASFSTRTVDSEQPGSSGTLATRRRASR
jgi:ABC-type polysaccharide/polyol phosphate transport system ATPase subunit